MKLWPISKPVGGGLLTVLRSINAHQASFADLFGLRFGLVKFVYLLDSRKQTRLEDYFAAFLTLCYLSCTRMDICFHTEHRSSFLTTLFLLLCSPPIQRCLVHRCSSLWNFPEFPFDPTKTHALRWHLDIRWRSSFYHRWRVFEETHSLLEIVYQQGSRLMTDMLHLQNSRPAWCCWTGSNIRQVQTNRSHKNLCREYESKREGAMCATISVIWTSFFLLLLILLKKKTLQKMTNSTRNLNQPKKKSNYEKNITNKILQCKMNHPQRITRPREVFNVHAEKGTKKL